MTTWIKFWWLLHGKNRGLLVDASQSATSWFKGPYSWVKNTLEQMLSPVGNFCAMLWWVKDTFWIQWNIRSNQRQFPLRRNTIDCIKRTRVTRFDVGVISNSIERANGLIHQILSISMRHRDYQFTSQSYRQCNFNITLLTFRKTPNPQPGFMYFPKSYPLLFPSQLP